MSTENSAAYIAQIEAWRTQRAADLAAPDSWLSLAGLFVLKDGYHTIGSSPANDIILPADAPDQIGIIEFRQGHALLNVTTSVAVLANGLPVHQIALVANGERKNPTLVTVGAVTFLLHNFGDLYAIRVKDRNQPALAAFHGCVWFAVNSDYRVQGNFTPHDATRLIPIKTSVNTTAKYKSVGVVDFVLQGQPLQFLATDYGLPNQLAIVFRDTTAGRETYAPGRFLTVDINSDGSAVLDFNKAYNPPCAFTPYATCPLPPRENILPIAIAAGERYSPANTNSQVNHGLLAHAA